MDEPSTRSLPRHAETTADLPASRPAVFEFLDDHRNLASHMSAGRSPMMAGSTMQLVLDAQHSRALGSHVVMQGKVLGLDVYLDEVVTERVVPEKKTWATVADRLVVIGPYRLGFLVTPLAPSASRLNVWIDYALPKRHAWLGRAGGSLYANWCVRQIAGAARVRFT